MKLNGKILALFLLLVFFVQCVKLDVSAKEYRELSEITINELGY